MGTPECHAAYMHNSGGILGSFGEGRQRVFIYFELEGLNAGRERVRRGIFNEEFLWEVTIS